MNVSTPVESEPIALVEIVRFKWLMAHEGRHVHVERMQRDPVYAAETLAWADASTVAALPEAAAALREALRPPR